VDFLALVFIAIVVLLVRGAFKAAGAAGATDRKRRLQQITQRMRAQQQQTRPGFPQPPGTTYGRQVGGPGFRPPPTAQPGSTAPFEQPMSVQPVPTAQVAPPSPPFTAQWPVGAPTTSPQRPAFDPVVVAVASDAAPESAYPTDEPTSGDTSPDTTSDVIENATAPTRQRYQLSSSLDTTLSTSLTSSVIGEPGSVANGPQTVSLSPQLQQQVLELMDRGYEVMAVRLVCDEMDVGILDAHKTVRTLAGLPTLM
jgi:hypothetical protein